MKVWDGKTGQELCSIKEVIKEDTWGFLTACFSPDGKRLVIAWGDGTVKVYDAKTGKELLTLKGNTDSIQCVCFSPDGSRLASDSWIIGRPGEVKVWDAKTGQEVLAFMEHADRVSGVCFSPDGSRLASASQDRTVRVWDAPRPGSRP